MEDRPLNTPTPAEEDPTVHRFLAALPRFAPGPAFDTRVLLNVWRPIPPRVRRAWTAVRDSWIVRALLVAMVGGSLLWQAVTVAWLVQHPGERAAALDWLRTEGIPLVWQVGTGSLSALLAPAYGAATRFVTGIGLELALAAALVLAVCWLGLYRTTRAWSPEGGRHAAR